ncbi:MAG TPA: hypothetical protein V6D22_22450 [Candidatus Obscuribacterales bacterium]
MPRPNNNYKSRIDTYLSGVDYDRFLSVCRQRRTTAAALAREAIRYHLDNLERAKENKVQSELSMNINNMTDRICGMLARQGVQTGVLFELAWQNHVENNARDRFVAATNSVKTRFRKRLEDDEKAIAERMRAVVKH